MERSHDTDVRRMLDKVSMELSQCQGAKGNVESCSYEVSSLNITNINRSLSVGALLQAAVFQSWNV